MPVYALGPIVPALPAAGRFYLAPGAHVIGEVELGEDVSVWFNASIRGDRASIRIGPRSNVQEGAVLHADPGFPLTIGEGVTVGHRAIVHGCTVGDNSLIGMGAVVLNGARIGPDSLVGAGALVTEGKAFPARSLIIGSPARVARELDDAAVEALHRSAQTYVDNLRRFRAELRPMD